MVGDWNAGFNLYLGNNPEATGRFGIPPEGLYAPVRGRIPARHIPQTGSLEYLRFNPLQAVRLVLARLTFLMNSEHNALICLCSWG